MSSRVNHFKTIPALAKTLGEASMTLGKASLDKKIKYLVDIRASQLNHCAFCLDMHVKEAKLHGERELRLYHVAIWRESPLFSAKEKAALALTEALTRLGEQGVSEALYSELREHFTEVEISELTFSIALINAWNRLQILSQMVPGALDSAYGLDRAELH
ncbi:carboxymuconolactone decarboxylase family protein [Rahnella aquatilis]|uniref:carboxymuconolactone decarboxylase family protein n=1 Tax=Rahnella aquatilis TaxID=34038 RepID=UPI000647943B|nr:carboxymuconolactone decarboxylase family protein [Rahnella aquatilis]